MGNGGVIHLLVIAGTQHIFIMVYTCDLPRQHANVNLTLI